MTQDTDESNKPPYLGFGLRLRQEHLQAVIDTRPAVDWFEIIPESFWDADKEILAQLDQIRTDYPLVIHSISLSIGSPWPLDMKYLKRLKQFIDRYQPAWVSDHLCWSGADDIQGQLLPLPYSTESLEHVVDRLTQVQDYLKQPFLLENVPTEEIAANSTIPEWDFLKAVSEQTGSLLLIDIASLQTSSMVQQFDPLSYLAQLPPKIIQQIHLTSAITLCGDEPGASRELEDPVWELYLEAINLFGPISTMIEREDGLLPLDELVCELQTARQYADIQPPTA
ncbi:MAG: DUF692 domain-containing protein [Gammaproteobacteria bacterium]|nr:DUF692 domain-containing protein [Gammaproteobacteria bacterium]